jgi:hypothetical protein
MTSHSYSVTLVSDLDALLVDAKPEPIVMVRPRHRTIFGLPQHLSSAEVVELHTVNLALLPGFETC